MPEVPTQTNTAAATVVHPDGQQPAAPVTPTGDKAPSTNNSSATSETPDTGAGRGVDLVAGILNPEQLQEAIAKLEEMQDVPEDDDLETAPPATAPAAAAPQAAPAAATTTATPAAAPVEDGLTKPGELPRNFKMPIRDELDLQVYSAIKQARLDGKALTFSEAETAVRKKLGLEPSVPQADNDQPSGTPAVAPANAPAQTTQTKLDEAYSRYQKARQDFDDVAEVAALQDINRLEREATFEVSRQAVVQTTEAEQKQIAFDQQWQATVQRTHQIYPDSVNPESPLTQKAAEIQEQYGASDDPAMQAIYMSPTSPLLFFQMAAAELQVTPASFASPAQPKSTPPPAPVTQAPPMSAILAGGHSSNNPVGQPGATFVDTIKDSHALDAAIEQYQESLMR